MLVALASLMLERSYRDLYTARVEQTRNAVENTQGILEHLHRLELEGALSREQAQQRR